MVRKRFALLWMLLVIGAAMALPASTLAATPGSIGFTSGYCSGANTVNATFKLVKYNGFYATKLTMTAKGQGYHNGAWRTEYNIGTWTKSVNTSARATMIRELWYDPNHNGRHRSVPARPAAAGAVEVRLRSARSGGNRLTGGAARDAAYGVGSSSNRYQ
jgi:hypothetical protein